MTFPAPFKNNNDKKMKKNYFSPELELVEMELHCALLAESDIVGGGINDDNSAGQSGETDPSEFDW